MPTDNLTPSHAGILPLSLANELRQGLKEILHTSFQPSTPGLEHLIRDFVEDPGNLFRGPYLGIDLPYVTAEEEGEFFPDVPLGRRPYRHQWTAFRRLQGSVRSSTLVATGTGSGKTECFLLPILDWCLRHAEAPGIKAIIVYPMNALADDQAKRLAAAIWHNPKLRDRVRAGLYADSEPEKATKTLTENEVIRSRQELEDNPPDILLTNYKMLDNLLLRPDRKGLWETNEPTTLRYLVVDELHTFDGAQGTDLACLIRRLKDRLGTPRGTLCCVGTSATLGDRKDTGSIVDYARTLFDEPFDDDAVVMADRVDREDFLDQAAEQPLSGRPTPDQTEWWSERILALDPIARVREYHRAWFGEEAPDDMQDEWKIQLGDQLLRHEFLAEVLQALDGGIQSVEDLAQRFQRQARTTEALAYFGALLESFITLIAFARRYESGGTIAPFLTVRVHLWVRELKRMVVSLPADAEDGAEAALPQLLHSADLSADQPGVVAPVVFCRECRGVAWLVAVSPEGGEFETNLDSLYSQYFYTGSLKRLKYLTLTKPVEGIQPNVECTPVDICLNCQKFRGKLPGSESDSTEACASCGERAWKSVWISTLRWTRVGSGSRSPRSAGCVYCGSRSGTGIFGMASTSMSSSLVSALFASKCNSDPKLLAFADSVQDVAHKAGYIEARGFRTVLRQAIAHWLSKQTAPVTYERLHARVAEGIRASFANDAEFVGTMTHVDLMWFRSIQALYDLHTEEDPEVLADLEQGRLDIPDDRDRAGVCQRLAWEAFSELTFRSQFGRTLENVECLTLSLDQGLILAAAREFMAEVREQLGDLFRAVDEDQCRQFLWGILHRMLHDGALWIDAEGIDPIGGLARHQGWFPVLKSSGVEHVYPNYGRLARQPLLPSLNGRDGFAPLTDAGSSARWYPHWARKCLAGGESLKGDRMADCYAAAFRHLTAQGLTAGIGKSGNAPVWAIKPDMVLVSTESSSLVCDRCQRRIHVHPDDAISWHASLCFNPGCRGRMRQGETSLDAPVLRSHLMEGYQRRVNARDHSGLLETEHRRRIENQFIQGNQAWYPNVLSTTPTLELGVDIGDLSSVLLYAVPPSQANYVQRMGRAGRRDGNSLGLTVVNARQHDLHFWEDPTEMIQGAVMTPGLYLEATAILRRQFNAYALERWILDTNRETAFGQVREALKVMENDRWDEFPLAWIGYVEAKADELLRNFGRLFGLREEGAIWEGLAAFAHGGNEGESFRSEVEECLRIARTERDQLNRRTRRLSTIIRDKRKETPPPLDLEQQIEALSRERRSYSTIVGEINRQDLLSLLTNHGILPNYSFPVEGIRLRSVIDTREEPWNRNPKQFEYQRSAVSGLRDFAPGNYFYAEGHRVRIDEIDLKISEVERWRICPSCPHMELASDENARVCPRCGDRQWRDKGQVRSMVRLRQVHAFGTERGNRIKDEQEERTQIGHARSMYPSFEVDTAQGSHVTDSVAQFGFEFLPHVDFRDVNFGESTDDDLMQVAGERVRATEYLLCDQCGRRLTPEAEWGQRETSPGTRAEPPWKKDHASTCPVLRKKDDQDHRITAFLYQSFRSEALRFLLPMGMDGDQTASFTAALQLGMRLEFKGQVDHIEVPRYSGGNTLTSHWLYLYDSVPGGTGYLERMVQPEVMERVLRKALQAMMDCSCNQDQEEDARRPKDGCYQCLYRYRSSRNMDSISRDMAIDRIRKILADWNTLEAVPNLDRVINEERWEESALEQRFLEWLEQKAKAEGGQLKVGPTRSGKRGYVFQHQNMVWEVEPQVMLGMGDSVREPSRADFLFCPLHGAAASALPIAVFLDGWRYHRGRIALDIRQRLAIRDSGKFRVWSMTWEDVLEDKEDDSRIFGARDPRHALSKSGKEGWNPLARMDITSADKMLGKGGRDWVKKRMRARSSDLLLAHLLDPRGDEWSKRVGFMIIRSILGQNSKEPETVLKRLDSLPNGVEGFDESLPLRSLVGLVEEGSTFVVAGASREELRKFNQEDLRVFLYLYEEGGDEIRHRHWRGALRLFNLLQFLPRSYWLCSSEIDPLPFPSPQPAPDASPDAWDTVLRYLDESLHELAMQLRQEGVAPPELGYELGTDDVIEGELEMAWPDRKLGILLEPLSDDLARALREDGWILLTGDEAQARLSRGAATFFEGTEK